MSDQPPPQRGLPAHTWQNWLAPLLAICLTTIYVGLVIAAPLPFLGTTVADFGAALQSYLRGLISDSLRQLGFQKPSFFLRHGTYLIAYGLAVPWIVATVISRGRPRDLGIRLPQAPAGRLLALSVCIAMPFLIWMVFSPGIADDYVPQFRRGMIPAMSYYLANMSAEHFLLHGLALALFRPGLRWPAEAPPLSPSEGHWFVRMLRWIGLAQDVEGRRGMAAVVRWMGLTEGCVPAIIGSGALFGLVHVGKDPRELLLSIPGGFASAYLAYRTGSMFLPFALHVCTGGLALLMMMARS